MKGQLNCIKIKEKNNHIITNFIEISQGGSNTNSGSKRGVRCRETAILYLAIIIRNLYSVI